MAPLDGYCHLITNEYYIVFFLWVFFLSLGFLNSSQHKISFNFLILFPYILFILFNKVVKWELKFTTTIKVSLKNMVRRGRKPFFRLYRFCLVSPLCLLKPICMASKSVIGRPLPRFDYLWSQIQKYRWIPYELASHDGKNQVIWE